MNEIKNCPFCGDKVDEFCINRYTDTKTGKRRWVLNHFCGCRPETMICSSVYADTKEEVISLWNRRAANG